MCRQQGRPVPSCPAGPTTRYRRPGSRRDHSRPPSVGPWPPGLCDRRVPIGHTNAHVKVLLLVCKGVNSYNLCMGVISRYPASSSALGTLAPGSTLWGLAAQPRRHAVAPAREAALLATRYACTGESETKDGEAAEWVPLVLRVVSWQKANMWVFLILSHGKISTIRASRV